MTCKDYKFGDMFSEHELSEEKMLAEKYILSIQCKEDPAISDQKYWDYFNHINELRSFDEELHNLISKIHEDERVKGLEGGLENGIE